MRCGNIYLRDSLPERFVLCWLASSGAELRVTARGFKTRGTTSRFLKKKTLVETTWVKRRWEPTRSTAGT